MMILVEKMNCRKFRSIMIIALGLAMAPALSCAGSGIEVFKREVPFHPGERLLYRAKWGVLPAGEVTLEVLPKETIEGVETYHFAMIMKTNAAVDLLYKIRERQDSYIDTDITHSILYKKRAEGKHPRDVIINFNWEKREAFYSNFGRNTAPIKILPGSFDPLALFFILRLHSFKESSVIEIPITDGKKNVGLKATIAKREIIKIGAKVYDTFAVIPGMESLENVVKKSDDPQLKIWFTADDRKVPVKIQSKVGVVSFIFELAQAEL